MGIRGLSRFQNFCFHSLFSSEGTIGTISMETRLSLGKGQGCRQIAGRPASRVPGILVARSPAAGLRGEASPPGSSWGAHLGPLRLSGGFLLPLLDRVRHLLKSPRL